jgi:transcriptional regulator with XRE-family HTH domain
MNERRSAQLRHPQLKGMRQPAIAQLEAGQPAPSFRTLARLAAVLEVEFNLRITADGFQLTA